MSSKEPEILQKTKESLSSLKNFTQWSTKSNSGSLFDALKSKQQDKFQGLITDLATDLYSWATYPYVQQNQDKNRHNLSASSDWSQFLTNLQTFCNENDVYLETYPEDSAPFIDVFMWRYHTIENFIAEIRSCRIIATKQYNSKNIPPLLKLGQLLNTIKEQKRSFKDDADFDNFLTSNSIDILPQNSSNNQYSDNLQSIQTIYFTLFPKSTLSSLQSHTSFTNSLSSFQSQISTIINSINSQIQSSIKQHNSTFGLDSNSTSTSSLPLQIIHQPLLLLSQLSSSQVAFLSSKITLLDSEYLLRKSTLISRLKFTLASFYKSLKFNFLGSENPHPKLLAQKIIDSKIAEIEFKFLTNTKNKINLYVLGCVGKEVIEDQMQKAVFEASEENEEAVKKVVVETGKDDSKAKKKQRAKEKKKEKMKQLKAKKRKVAGKKWGVDVNDENTSLPQEKDLKRRDIEVEEEGGEEEEGEEEEEEGGEEEEGDEEDEEEEREGEPEADVAEEIEERAKRKGEEEKRRKKEEEEEERRREKKGKEDDKGKSKKEKMEEKKNKRQQRKDKKLEKVREANARQQGGKKRVQEEEDDEEQED